MNPNRTATPTGGPLLQARSAWMGANGHRTKKQLAAVMAVACAHVLVLLALVQTSRLRPALHEVAPLMVALLAQPAAAEPVSSTPPPLVAAPLVRPFLMPVAAPEHPAPIAQPASENQPFPAPARLSATEAAAAPAQPAAGQANPAEAAPVLTQAPTPPAAPAPRKVLAATAVRYLLEPPVEVPRAARRAGEHGVVVLRVVVSAQGLPTSVTVQRSSGYSRLDEQAVWAMRQARFQPYVEDGRAVEVEVLAPIDYPLD